MTKEFKTFAEFYPFYLSEHSNQTCRRLHFIGSSLVVLVLLYALFSGRLMLLLWLPVIGYGFAWVGHFVFEKNRPATFKYPLYSLAGDWVMFKDILIGKIRF
ncbi:Mpo1-like protein [Alkalimarinus coralli]|uniref:Mpo1-like protein n=1 Tax=Alkalimarinus coralli TaxID=2935863 RepID=UPI00202B0C02|nr:Mpo1-like protein [Alkalimarinus coralli]